MKDRIITNRLKITNGKFLADSLNLLQDMVSGGKKPKLLVPIRATHSGYLLNNRVYPGFSMRDAAETWVKPYERPVLKHHDGNMDAIGRVKAAKYYQLKMGNEFEQDYQNPDTGLKLGSGFIIIDTEITDPDAIEKIIDGRLSTVSTSHTNKSLVCSACGVNWMGADADECGHWPGQPYVDKKSGDTIVPYLISVIKDYKENSFVNEPAQPNTKIISKELVEDSLKENLYITDGICSLDSLYLQDFEGNSVDLLLSEGIKDQMPKEAMDLLAKKVFTFTSKDDSMTKKTSDKTDEAIEKAKKDADAAKVATETVTTTVVVDSKAETKPEVKAETKVADSSVVSNTVLVSALEEVTASKDQLLIKVKELQTSLEAKTAVADELTKEVAKLKADNVKQLANQLAITRVNLGKAGNLKGTDGFDGYVAQLAMRSADSLRDALNDLLPELDQLLKDKGKVSDAFVHTKVDSPVKSEKDNTNKGAKEKSKELQSKTDFLDGL